MANNHDDNPIILSAFYIAFLIRILLPRFWVNYPDPDILRASNKHDELGHCGPWPGWAWPNAGSGRLARLGQSQLGLDWSGPVRFLKKSGLGPNNWSSFVHPWYMKDKGRLAEGQCEADCTAYDAVVHMCAAECKDWNNYEGQACSSSSTQNRFVLWEFKDFRDFMWKFGISALNCAF